MLSTKDPFRIPTKETKKVMNLLTHLNYIIVKEQDISLSQK